MTTSELSKAVDLVKTREKLQDLLNNNGYIFGLAYKLPAWCDYITFCEEGEDEEVQQSLRDFIQQRINAITKELESLGVTD